MIMKILGYSPRPFTDPGAVTRLEHLLSNLSGGELLAEIAPDEESESDLCGFGIDTGFIANEISKELARIESLRLPLGQYGLGGTENTEPRSHGSVHFVTPDKSITLHLYFDDWVLAPFGEEKRFGNIVSLQIQRDVFSGAGDGSIRELCKAFFSGSDFSYGYCCTDQEYTKQNIDRSGGGERAVGLDASRVLPGLYWGNYFGDYLKRVLPGLHMHIPGFVKSEVPFGTLLLRNCVPWHWNSEQVREESEKAISQIGDAFFFNGQRRQEQKLVWSLK